MSPINTVHVSVVLALVALSACGGDSSGDPRGDGGDGGDGGTDAGQRVDGGISAGDAIVFAHDSATLFALDPNTLQVRVVGPMSGCQSVVDIAVSANNEIFGSGMTTDGQSGILAIDPNTGACQLHVAGGFANALSFVPKGVLHPDKEMLVSFGIADGTFQYVSIDPDSGVVAGVGPVPAGYGSSGDIVSVEGGGTYWTATGPCFDCLVELNPTTGELIKDWGPLGYSAVWGLAYWGGVVYGFTSAGEVLRITFTDGVMSVNVAAMPGYSFFGAGSSTKAPIIVD